LFTGYLVICSKIPRHERHDPPLRFVILGNGPPRRQLEQLGEKNNSALRRDPENTRVLGDIRERRILTAVCVEAIPLAVG